MNRRPERVSSLIKEELAKIIQREIEFNGFLVTLTDIDVDSKLGRAVVNFSVIPSDYFGDAFKILNRNKKHLQYLLMKKINIKPMPEILFKMDRGLENAALVEKILLEDDNK